jgi:hypothetical protein
MIVDTLTSLCQIIPMNLTRTTVRLPEPLKKAAVTKALELNITFQDLVSQALSSFLNQMSRKKAKKIVFPSHDLGVPLDNLTREDYYAD